MERVWTGRGAQMERLTGCAGIAAGRGRANRKQLVGLAAGLMGAALIGLLQPVSATQSNIQGSPRAADAWAHHSDVYAAFVEYAQQVGVADSALIASAPPKLARAEGSNPHGSLYQDPAYSALADFVQQIETGQPSPAGTALPDQGGLYSALLAQEAAATDSKLVVAQNAAPKAPKAPKKTAAVKAPAAAEATIVGSQVCMTCHANQAATFAQTLMGKYGKVKKGTMECENCHGAGSAHVKAGGGRGVGGIISFRPNDTSRTAAENNAICLTCHDKGNRTLWQGSTHEEREVACTNCHRIMKSVSPKFQLARATQQDTCFQCHKNKRAEIWRTSHMPIREGKVKCTDCHNPHGSFSESLLKEASVNDTCYQCHAEKRGPFLFEHAPVRESCVNCHDPHGSINDFMLKISRPRLCQQCHSTLTGHPANPRNPQSIFAFNRECQNCHSQHHGSNSPSGARFQR